MTVDFGRDLWCLDDLDPGRTVTGALLVAQAAYRRITTPRGAVIDAPNYGFDVRALLGKGLTPAQLAAIPGQVRGEILKDERVDSCSITATYTGGPNGTLTLSIDGETAAGPFNLVLAVTEVNVEILQIGAR